MTERTVLSPLTNTTPIRPPLTKYLSPSTSRTAGLASPGTALSNFDDHDEDLQKKERRRKSQAFDIHRRVLGSPSTVTRSPADNLNGLTSTQLASHYSDCIKLSAENKITSKNAFGLHLIDYMTELLRKKQLENFQVASSTLDASVKIYAGRVDFIHTSTYKVLAGLGGGKTTADEEDKSEDVQSQENAEEVMDIKSKKKKKVARTVETNLKNINADKFDLEFEVDPMFQIMSAAFDEGGARGLLLNRLRTFHDSQQLVLDSSTLIDIIEEDTVQNSQPNRKPASFSELLANLENIDLDNCQICPSLTDFHFLKIGGEDSILPKSFSEFAFDPTPDPHIASVDEEVDAIATEEIDDGDGFDGDVEYQGSLVSNFNALSVRESHTSEFVESAFSDLAQGNASKLRLMLATQPTDYSYFNNVLLQAWAGPAHWKLASSSRQGTNETSDKHTKKRTKKQPFKLTFDMTDDEEKRLLKQSKPDSICISKKTWAGYTKKRTTLPEDKQVDKQEKLFCLFSKPHIKIKPAVGEAIGVDDGIENYDLNNKNDVENFCPVPRDDDGDDDLSAAGFDLSNETNFVPASQDNSSQSVFNSLALNGTILTQDKLVAAPNKVQKIDIQYAKSAKRVDVKKLKSTIWSILTKDTAENTEAAASDLATDISVKMQTPCHLSELTNTLPTKVSTTMAKNLTIQTVFGCSLYITNEKNLKLTSTQDMTDIIIEQDSF
ncbi:hypothetical protein Btru_073028 [Bulinus truncatus]|nr:hypothetical protein Btru_073028 [Bulinus truncatus]